MSLKISDMQKMLDTLGHLEKKGKKKVSDIDDMEGCFANLFPKDKTSVDIIRENREKQFKA